MLKCVVFTDLDGTLLDPATYSFQAAAGALDALREREIPVVLVSSKTRAEIEPLRFSLDNRHPFIVENGGALYIPRGLFNFPLEGSTLRGPYQVVEFGTPYATARNVLKEMEQSIGQRLRGFGDMSPEEIAERTGLSQAEALLAKQREYDEPFVFDGIESVVEELARQAEMHGLCVTRGGRFCHLTGRTDKGNACRPLIDWYRRQQAQDPQAVLTIGVGDGLNDAPLLAVVDRPIAVQRPGGAYEPALLRPGVIRAPGVGPLGWNQAILELLRESEP